MKSRDVLTSAVTMAYVVKMVLANVKLAGEVMTAVRRSVL